SARRGGRLGSGQSPLSETGTISLTTPSDRPVATSRSLPVSPQPLSSSAHSPLTPSTSLTDAPTMTSAVRRLFLLPLLILSLVPKQFGQAAQALKQDYLLYVVCESADQIALIRFGQQGARVEKLIETGSMPSDIDGPHGIVVSPDKKFYYVSLGHGRPF